MASNYEPFFLFIFNCTEKTPLEDVGKNFTSVGESQCINCHTNEDLLKQVAEPLPDAGGEGSGEG